MSEQKDQWTAGAHHVGLTVPDLSAAAEFFEDGLGFDRVGEKPNYPAVFVSDGAVMVTLWQADDSIETVPFDRKRNLGLHHLAIRTRPGSLGALHQRLAEREDVEIEIPPETLGAGPTRHMMTRIPGRIRVEFIDPDGV